MRIVLTGMGLAALALAPSVHAQNVPNLPEEMRGIWAFEPGDCNDQDSDGRVRVEGRRVESFAATFEFRQIQKTKDGYRAISRRFDEGEEGSTRDIIELKILPGGKLKIFSSVASDLEYHRCPAGAKPVR